MKHRTPSLLFALTFSLVIMAGSPRLLAGPKDPPAPEAAADAVTSGETIPTYVQRRIFKKVWKEKEVDFLIRSAAVGDFDGDGLNELITTNGKTLRLVQWNHGRFKTPSSFAGEEEKRSSFLFWKKEPEGIDPLKAVNEINRNLNYITLTAGDLDGNGRDEILYRGMAKNQLHSGILQFSEGQFSKHPGEPGIYLDMFHTGDGDPVLVGQNLASSDERINHYTWSGEDLVEEDFLTLPRDVKLFSAQSYYSQDAVASAYVSVADPGAIHFYRSDLHRITAVDALSPPTLCSIRIRTIGENGDSVKKRFEIPKRFLSGDFDGDGRDEVMLILKRPVLDARGLRMLLVRNTVANLVLSNGTIREYWNTKPIFGEILDQTVGDIDNNGRDELILFTKKGIVPFRKRTQILIYELNLQGNGTG